MTLYELSIGTMMKNEEHVIVEWITHHKNHGIDHFYIFDDSSDDKSVDLLKPYIESGIVTFFTDKVNYYLGRQRDIYNTYFLPIVNKRETKWLIMLDLDEFLWSPKDVNLKNIFSQFNNLAQIQFEVFLFGSNGHIKQPESIVKGFTKRNSTSLTTKYTINTDYGFTSLNVHRADFVDNEKYNNGNYFIKIYKEWLVVNHYSCQSRELWENVKCKRGDSDNYIKRNIEMFYELDYNEIEDTDLAEQNKHF